MSFLVWSLVIGLPTALLGAALLVKGELTAKGMVAFGNHRKLSIPLVVVGWLWTAHALDIIGIDVFDKFLKAFPGELWILALILIPLTYFWMPKHLAMRGLSAILMLYPAVFFQCARQVESSWRLVAVAWTYVLLTLGMYAMFYPWRIQTAIEWLVKTDNRRIALGGVLAAAGVAVLVSAFLV